MSTGRLCAHISRQSANGSTGTARLSVDYIMPIDSAVPLLIDCNPRLVEPVNAYRAGTDLVDLLLRVSLGETPAALPDSREGVVTHLAMQALLGCASRGGTRRDIIAECRQL